MGDLTHSVDLEVRLAVMEKQLEMFLLAAPKDDAEFRAEMRAFIAEQRALKPGYDRRLDEAERSIRELLQFKAKLLGAVAAAGALGGVGGGIAAALLQLLGP